LAQRLPPELENKIARIQQLQTQYNRIVQERVAVESEVAEINRVLKVLSEVQDATVYRMVGGILVRVERDKVRKELEDRKEILELRLQKLRKQEQEIRKQLEQLTREVQQLQQKFAIGKGGAG